MMFEFDRKRALTESESKLDRGFGRSRRCGRFALSGVLCACLILSRNARAEGESSARARAAYDAGASAYNADDFGLAAKQFARADELVPNPAVLKLALAAAVRAEDAVLSMNLVLRAERRAWTDEALLELVRVTRNRFESQVGFIEVRCESARACQARLAEQRLEPGLPLAAAPGKVELRFGEGQSESRVSVDVVAARTLEVLEPTPASTPEPAKHVTRVAQRLPVSMAESQSFGFARGVFWGGVALSGALTALTVASGVDAAHAHDRFLANRNEDTRNHGQAAVERTNVLLGATLGVAALTGAVGLFFTHWRAAAPHATRAPTNALAVAF